MARVGPSCIIHHKSPIKHHHHNPSSSIQQPAASIAIINMSKSSVVVVVIIIIIVNVFIFIIFLHRAHGHAHDHLHIIMISSMPMFMHSIVVSNLIITLGPLQSRGNRSSSLERSKLKRHIGPGRRCSTLDPQWPEGLKCLIMGCVRVCFIMKYRAEHRNGHAHAHCDHARNVN